MEVLQSFDFKKNRGRKSHYEWDIILDGKILQLSSGKDFSCKPKSFVHLVTQKAKSLNKKVRVSVKGDTVVVQSYED